MALIPWWNDGFGSQSSNFVYALFDVSSYLGERPAGRTGPDS